MAYKCLFMDNGIYTAQDVNDAISNIVSGGVSGYPFGIDAVSDLNTAIAELANGGTEYKGTSCLVVNIGGTYKISEGVAIMNDGSQIIFDSAGYEISHQSGVYEYVYLERDVLHNTINAVVSGEAGEIGTIPLAEIKADGTILDRRRFAKAKISLSAEPQNISISKRLQFEVPGNGRYSYDLGFNGWKYVIVRTGYNAQTGSWAYTDVLELNDNESTGFFPYDNTVYSNTSHLRHYFDVVVTRSGSVLVFQTSNNGGRTFNVEIEVR